MDINARACKAFGAARELGIPDAHVKLVLKRLLEVYKNWKFIEAENYRVLLDACFEFDEQKEEQEGGDKLGQTTDDDDGDDDCDDRRLYKKLHIGELDAGVVSGANEQAQRLTEEDLKDLTEVKTEKVEPDLPSQALDISFKRKDPMLSPSVIFSGASKATNAYDARRYATRASHESSSSNSRREVCTVNLTHHAKTTRTSDSHSSGNKESNGPRASNLPSPENDNKASASCQNSLFRFLSDITKGTEREKISLVDTARIGDMPKFTYIPQNLVYQNAYVRISLARISDADCCSSCCGDCLSALVPCECARETGGEFAYTEGGLLSEKFLAACVSMKREPDKHPFSFYYCQDCPLEKLKNEARPKKCDGHLIKKFIKECWRKCGCDMECGNRVVQRGITCKLQVYSTQGGKGWGVRTLQDLPRGAFVCEYVGEIVTNTELHERIMKCNGNERHTYPVYLDADWGSEKILEDDEALCLDATLCGNVARFINHRCEDANLVDVPVEIESPDRHYYHIAFFTVRPVQAMEELTWDYSIDFSDHSHPIKAFRCCCGSKFCRDKPKTRKVKRGLKSAKRGTR